MSTLTAPQARALAYYAMSDEDRCAATAPRADVRDRLTAMGMLTVRTAMVNTGMTYRSRQRLAVVAVNMTETGREALAAHPEGN